MKAFLMMALSLTAFAEEKKVPDQFCTPAKKIFERTESCDDNDAFMKEGEKCLKKLYALSNSQAAVMNLLKAGDTQKTSFSTATKDYAVAVANLTYLIAVTKKATDEVDDYLNYIVIPDEVMEEDFPEKEVESASMKEPCFGETKKSLESILDDFENHLKKLEEAKAAALAMGGTTQGQEGKLDASGANQQTLKGAAPKDRAYPAAGTRAPGKGGLDQEPRSDISGTEKVKKK